MITWTAGLPADAIELMIHAEFEMWGALVPSYLASQLLLLESMARRFELSRPRRCRPCVS
jgi:hypothetical protein